MITIFERIRKLEPEKRANLVDKLFIGLALVFLIWQLHPSLILSNTTTAGGDTGAHFIVPWLAEHQVFNHFRLTGWSSAWYDGFPLLGFYFPLPSILVAILNIFISYDVAFKLITVLGSLIFIPSLYTLGKKFGLPRPIPVCLSLVGIGYLFNTSYTIDGGNLASTLAGEYSFSLSLALGIYVVAIAAKKKLTNKDMALGALLFGLSTLAHILPSFWVGFALVFLVLLKRVFYKTWEDLPRTVGIVLIAACLTAFWALPFAYRISYSTSMGWTKVTTYGSSLFPHSLKIWVIMAVLGVLISVIRRQILGILLAILGILAVATFVFLPPSAVYNARALPFWVLSLYLLSGIFLGNCAILISSGISWIRALIAQDRERSLSEVGPTGPSVDGVNSDDAEEDAGQYVAPKSLIGLEIEPSEIQQVLIPEGQRTKGSKSFRFPLVSELSPKGSFLTATIVSAVVFLISGLGLFTPISWLPIHPTQSFVPSWIRWNYTGYEAKPGYPEYRNLMVKMQSVAKEYGCGPAMWEYNSQENSYGTPMALMLLPYWTGTCIGSMEGLFFESSATTPFHFLDQSELSAFPSDAMAGLPYKGLNVKLGVQHLQLLGVRYYMAFSPNVIAQANRDPELRKIATVPAVQPSAGQTSALGWTWNIYLVKNSTKVVPLTRKPVVLNGIKANQVAWDKVAIPWYDNPSKWSVVPAQSGPSSWPHVAANSTSYPSVPVPSTRVTAIKQSNESISFNVSTTGVPVLVKISYFPNWQVKGGTGPYRVAPNLMVVVPTSKHVVVYYGMTPIDYTGYAVSLITVLGLVAIFIHPRSKHLQSSID